MAGAVSIAILLVLGGVLVMCAAAGLLIAGAVRRARRSVAVTRGRLIGRAAMAPNGPARAAGRLRVRLHRDVTSTARSIAEVGRPVELVGPHRSLWAHARDLDRRLALLGAEPDRVRAAALLPALTDEAAALGRIAAELRTLSWQFAAGPHRPGTADTLTELADQVAGIRFGMTEVDRIQARSGSKGH